jgi:putative heme-binding domain-containing protein
LSEWINLKLISPFRDHPSAGSVFVFNLRGWKTRCWNVAIILLISVVGGSNSVRSDEEPPFAVPEGFSVVRVADDSMAHDCFCMTLDGLGRPVVSGPGYIRTLVDDDGDGKYDRSFLWTDLTKQGAQGLWSEGRKLYYVSEGGLWLSEDNDGDLRADPNPKKVLELPTGGEHFAHAIRRGPDGYWYLIAGNFARDISKLQNDPLSPVARSRSGTIWRMSPDFSKRGVWAHGMRNCYDFDFMPDGQIVTFDSDCEREATLPWYRPTRVMVLGPGSDAGWCGQSWKDEDHRITMPLVLAQLGRGSPTGVAVYQHRAFPKKYHDAVFVLDWTFGRVMAIHPSSNLDESKRIANRVPAEVFMQPSGTAGFAPTDICVGMDGSLLICVGGRGTTGAIYKVMAIEPPPFSTGEWFAVAVKKEQLSHEQAGSLERLLKAEMPTETWSETKWFPEVDKASVKGILGVMSGEIPIAAAPEIVAAAKMRCAQVLTRLNIQIPFSRIQNLLGSPTRSVRAAGWWLAGRGNVAISANDSNAIGALAALDFGTPSFNSDANDQLSWELHLGRADERLRWEAYGVRKWSVNSANSLEGQDNESGNALRRTWLWALARSGTPLSKKSDANKLDFLIANQLFTTTQTSIDSPLLDALATWVPNNQPRWKTRDSLEFLTVLQASLGERRLSLPQQQDPPQPDVMDGFRGLSASKLPENVRTAWIGWALYLAKQAEGNNQLVHSEAMRALAMLEPRDSESIEYFLNQITKDSHPTSDIYALCCAANCQNPRTREMSTKSAIALSGIVRKVSQRNLYTDNQWPIRMQQLVSALLRRDDNLGAEFLRLMVACVPEDLVLLSAFSIDDQTAIRKKLIALLLESEPSNWSIPVLKFAGKSSFNSEFEAAIRASVAVPSLRQIAIELLSSQPSELDYDLYLNALASSDRDVWPAGWKGLSGLARRENQQEWMTLASVVARTLHSTSGLPRPAILARARDLAAKLKFGNPPSSEQWVDWELYFRSALDAESFAKLPQPQSTGDWRSLHAAANAIAGDAKRGKELYQEKCALCHGGQSSLGPSLSGVSKRFSRDDLSVAIFEPNRDISERFKSFRVLTIDDEIFTGMVVYSAADGTTLQTASGAIVRINKENIADSGESTESLMPTGLLNDKSPTDVADLYAYLGTQ